MDSTKYDNFIKELPNIFRKDGFLYFKYDTPVETNFGDIKKTETEISLYYDKHKNEFEIDMGHIELLVEFSNYDGPIDIRVWYLKNDYIGESEQKKIINYLLCNLLDKKDMIDDYTDPKNFYDNDNYKKYLDYQSKNKKKSYCDMIKENNEVMT